MVELAGTLMKPLTLVGIRLEGENHLELVAYTFLKPVVGS
jgi:hypothetical protein